MPRTSDRLFDLINALSPSEKRYFRLQSGLHDTDHVYFRLFDALDQMSEYDEKTLREEFRGERFLKQLSVAKSYLYTTILRSLRRYHEDASVESRVAGLMHETKILFSKGLYEQAWKIAVKAEKITREGEMFAQHLKASAWKEFLGRALNKSDQRADFSGEIATLERHQNTFTYSNLLESMGDATVRAEEPDIEAREALAASPAMQDESLALTLTARIMLCDTWAYYHASRGEFEEALNYRIRLRTLYESNPVFLQQHVGKYASVVSHIAQIQSEMGDVEGMLETMELLREKTEEIINETPFFAGNLRAQTSVRVHEIEFEFFRRNGNRVEATKSGLKLLRDIEEHLDYMSPHILRRYYRELAWHFLVTGDIDRATLCFDELMKLTPRSDPQSVHHHLLLFELLLLVERQEFELLLSRHRSLSRRIPKLKEPIDPVVPVMLVHIRTIARGVPESIDDAFYSDWNEELKSLTSSGLLVFPGRFNYGEWVEGRF